MSNITPNPTDPPPSPTPGSPWIYSNTSSGTPPGSPAPGYYTPPPAPAQPPAQTPIAPPESTPAAASPPPSSPPPPAPASATLRRPAAPGASNNDASLASIIDTIEAIIIALIIALSFRAFVVEAFVIPTGSMAPTLLGAHVKVICPKCGYEFDKDASLEFQAHPPDAKHPFRHIDDRDPHAELINNNLVPSDGLPVYCPNCRYPVLPEQFPQYLGTFDTQDARMNVAVRKIPYVWVNNGDRILVMKYLYSLIAPQRWDVIVFKEPQLAKDNYIKRLIGLPNETVEIIGGDIYIAPRMPHEPTADIPKPDPSDQKIARKPDFVQQNVWQLVYNNDYYPTDEGKPRPFIKERDPSAPAQNPTWINPWQPGPDHWTKGPVMAYDGAGPSSLTFNSNSFGRDNPPYTLNTLGYNNDIYSYLSPGDMPISVVGDLRLETVWTPRQADGTDVSLTLGRPNNCFRVSWSAAGLSLTKYDQESSKFVSLPAGSFWVAPVTPVQKDHAYHLALNNVDHAVRFYLDGRPAIIYEPEWTARDAVEDSLRYPNTVDRANAMISIDVSGPALLGHLKLFRDLYYTQVTGNGPGTGIAGNAVTLANDEFFALGDNSRRSADGRAWDRVYPALNDLAVRKGIVPRRYLLGKAFFVYWPAGFRATDSQNIPLLPNIPIVPDAGDMRLIR